MSRLIANAVFPLVICVLLGSSSSVQPRPAPGTSNSQNLSSIIVKQLRPRWEEQSLGQSAATASSTEYHVAVAASPAELVARQRVLLNSTDGGTAASELGPSGGVVKLTNVALGAEITTVVTIEFLPELALPAMIKQYKSTATAAGAIALFQLFSDETTCFLDPGRWTRCNDYLTCRLTFGASVPQDSQILHLLKTSGATSQTQTAQFLVVRDSDAFPEPAISIAGRFGGASPRVIGTFTVSELENAGALIPSWAYDKCQIVLRPIGTR